MLGSTCRAELSVGENSGTGVGAMLVGVEGERTPATACDQDHNVLVPQVSGSQGPQSSRAFFAFLSQGGDHDG